MFRNLFLLTAGILLLLGCGHEDDDILMEHSSEPSVEGVYIQENQWIYHQMNRHYLWRQDLPDSLACNYLLDPVSFFKSLLSTRDRFSYCEHNDSYSQYTRGISDVLNPVAVLCDSIYAVGEHRVGYLCYRSFQDAEDLEPVMKHFYEEHITDLVLDLRYNGGGLISTCQYLCSSIVPESAYGQLMEYLQYNELITQERIRKGQTATYQYRFRKATDGQPTLGLQVYGLRLTRLYVLTSRQTASASESTVICLRPYMSVVTIGEQTTGKGVGMETLHDSRYKYQLVPITFRYYNVQDETVPDDGLTPDVPVGGALDVSQSQIGCCEEPLLHEALSLILSRD